MKPTEALRPWIPEQPSPMKPTRPYVRDLEELPELDPNWREELAKLRALLGAK